MTKYILKRLLRSLLTLFIIMTIVFSLLRLMPIEGYFNNFDKLTETQIQVKLNQLGLNDPLPVQLLHFYGDVLHGDLGTSNKYREGASNLQIILEKIPISLTLGLVALAIALAVGLPLGHLDGAQLPEPMENRGQAGHRVRGPDSGHSRCRLPHSDSVFRLPIRAQAAHAVQHE